MSIETQKFAHPVRLGLPTLIATAFLAAAVAFDVSKAQADDLVVKFDQSQLLRLPRAAADIVIGNPTIADVSIQGGNMLIITGKSYGITNIIALDADHNVIQDQRVVVERDESKVVHLYKGTGRESYNCGKQCNGMLVVGDETKFFDSIKKGAGDKRAFSDGAGGADAGGQGQ